jgi:HEAT repeat protein
MKPTNVIVFQSQERVLIRARAYVDDPRRFLAERDHAVPLLLKALKLAEPDLKSRIILLLGGFAKEEIVGPLYDLLTDPDQDDAVRHHAAVQLSVTGALLSKPQPLVVRLVTALANTNSAVRAGAAFALGWRGNTEAAIPLIDLLYDPDPHVQQAAVHALANLQEDRVLGLLLDRLEHASVEQRRSILCNLWRFSNQREAVVRVCLRIAENVRDTLRVDALILLGMIGGIKDHRGAYRKFLRDPDARVRELAYKHVAGLRPQELTAFENDISAGLDDSHADVKRAALTAFKRLRPLRGPGPQKKK